MKEPIDILVQALNHMNTAAQELDKARALFSDSPLISQILLQHQQRLRLDAANLGVLLGLKTAPTVRARKKTSSAPRRRPKRRSKR